jgi:hypothetical protein
MARDTQKTWQRKIPEWPILDNFETLNGHRVLKRKRLPVVIDAMNPCTLISTDEETQARQLPATGLHNKSL